MSADAAAHIAENRIIQIIAERGELQPAERAHLERCTPCRAMLRELEADLERLRRQALATAPTPERHFILPTGVPGRPSRGARRLGWATVGTVLSAALLMFFLQLGPEKRLPGLPTETPPVAQWEDPELIKVNRLAENPLPKAYLALSESLEGVYDEAFIDFLIPPLDDDSVS